MPPPTPNYEEPVTLAVSCYRASSGVLVIIAVSSPMSAGIDAVVVASPLMLQESRLFCGPMI